MKKVLLVGTPPSRESLKVVFCDFTFALAGEASTPAEACRLLDAQSADVVAVCLDDQLAESAADALHQIRLDHPMVKVVLLGEAAALAAVWQAHPTAIDGYLLRTMPAGALMHAIDLVMLGQQVFPPRSAARRAVRAVEEPLAGATVTSSLSAREGQILQLLAVGSSNKAIARNLTISTETVKVHMRALLRKLNARNRTQAAMWALAHGMMQAGPPNQSGTKRGTDGPTSSQGGFAVPTLAVLAALGLGVLDALVSGSGCQILL